jgi:hypothetical protein
LPLSTIFVHKFELFSLLMYNSICIWKASTSCVALMVEQFSLQSRAPQMLEIYFIVVSFILLLYTHCSRGSDIWPFLPHVLPIGYYVTWLHAAHSRFYHNVILVQFKINTLYTWYIAHKLKHYISSWIKPCVQQIIKYTI